MGPAEAAPPSRGRIHIGISGWRYAGWRGKFYPPRLAQRRELEYASRTFSTIEINGTFYSLQRPESFAHWAAETPENFLFSLKGSRFITHMKKLRGVEEALSNYFAQGVLRLSRKLGPILWQFPPNLAYDRERFAAFFALLPRTAAAAAALAEAHSPRLKDRAWTEVDHDGPLRHCVEVRHESFSSPDFIALLREHRIGLVVADTVEWPLLLDLTADFVYCRLHGSEQLYTSGYEAEAITLWAERVVSWSGGAAEGTAAGNAFGRGRFASPETAPTQPRDVFVYFDNDAKVRAPVDAQALQARVGELTRTRKQQPGKREGSLQER